MSNEAETELLTEQEPQALEAISRAEIDIQIKTARAYPRAALSKIKERVLSDCTLDEETASSCFYKLPRGGSMIEGPSVRLAEIVAGRYGNLRVATRTTETVTEGANPHVVVLVAIHDLENNLAIQVEKRRRITGKKSKGGKPDEDDINLATNACASIAFRDAVFRVVPNVLTTPALEACKKIAKGNASSLSERRVKMLQRLAQLGASEARVLKSLGLKKVEDITLEHVEDLIGRGTALKDGGMVEDIFPIEGEGLPQSEVGKQQADKPVVAQGEQGKAERATTGEPPGNEPSAQAQVEDFVLRSGYTFDDLMLWGDKSGVIPDAGSIPSFAEVPAAICKRLLRATTGLLKGLEQAKESRANQGAS